MSAEANAPAHRQSVRPLEKQQPTAEKQPAIEPLPVASIEGLSALRDALRDAKIDQQLADSQEERAKAERSRRRKEKATAAKQTAAKEANRQRQRETLGHCAEAARRVALGLRRTVSGVMEARAHALRKREDEAAKACP